MWQKALQSQTLKGTSCLILVHRFDRQQLAELSGLPLVAVNDLIESPLHTDVRKFDIEMPGGFAVRNINSDDDANRALYILKILNLSVEATAKLLAGPNLKRIVLVHQAAEQQIEEGGNR